MRTKLVKTQHLSDGSMVVIVLDPKGVQHTHTGRYTYLRSLLERRYKIAI